MKDFSPVDGGVGRNAVCLANAVELPARFKVLCEGIQEGVINHLGLREVVIEPTEVKGHGIHVARVLVDNTLRILVRIVNVTSQKVNVNKNTIIGYAVATSIQQKQKINTAGIENGNIENTATYFKLKHLDTQDRDKHVDVPPISKAPYRVPHSQRKVLQSKSNKCWTGR